MARRKGLIRGLSGAVAMLMAAAVLAACGDTGPKAGGGASGSGANGGGANAAGATGATGATASAGTPKQGGNLTFLIQEFPSGWVSSVSNISSYEGNLWGEITDKLVYVNAAGKVSPWVLSSWKSEDNATKFILHIKPGITFSDGEKMNAAAVIDNINIWARGDKKRGIAQVGLFPALNYKGAKALNDSTVEVDFSKPTLGFIPTLGYHGCILLAPRTLALSVTQQADLSKEIGSGPFVVKSFKQGVSYVLQRRSDYHWGPPALGHTGPAYLKTLTYKIVADATTREEAVQSGDAQVDFNPNVSDIPSLEREGLSIGTPKYLGFSNGFDIQADEAPFNQLPVRQALQHAINRQQIVSTIYPPGVTTPAETFIQSNVPEAANDASLITYNPSESEKLLDTAGWKVGKGGYRYKGGKQLTFSLIPNPYVPQTQQEDELISQQLKKVGINAPLKIIPLANYAVVQKPPIPPVLSQSRSFVDFSTVGGVLTSLNGGENWFGVGTSDKTLDRLSKQIEGASSDSERDSAAAAVQKYVVKEGYYIPVDNLVQRIYAYAKNVHGVSYNGLAYANFYTAWLS